MTLRPVQRPHPPLWFGISHAGRAEWAAEHEVNVVALLPAGMVRPITDAYRAEWEARGRAPEDIPFMGVSRLIVVAETDDEAMSVARRAYRRWFESINLLWRKYDVPSPLDGVLPEDFADWHAAGAGFAGTPPRRCEYIAAQEEEAGINYFCADLAFGDITFEEAVAHGRALRARDHPRVRPGRARSSAATRARASPPWPARSASPSRRRSAPGGATRRPTSPAAGGLGAAAISRSTRQHARGSAARASTAASESRMICPSSTAERGDQRRASSSSSRAARTRRRPAARGRARPRGASARSRTSASRSSSASASRPADRATPRH